MAWIGIVLLAVTCVSTPARPVETPGLQDAVARIRAGDMAGAAKILEAVTERDPTDAQAWRTFGFVSIKLKAFDRAIACYKKSLAIAPDAAPALYNLGVAYALRGDKDLAFDSLGKAKATRKIDMTQSQVDPDLESLRADPRFAALQPTRADFADPFVEPVTVVREWDGEATNDQFGWIARDAGDVDKDGADDVFTSAPTKDVGGANAGRVYLYSTRTGKLLWSADGRPGDKLGWGLEAAGDTNRDGVPDVVAGAPGAGKVYVYSGRDGRVLLTLSAANAAGGFGLHASGAGDVDRDGYADVAVGAPTEGGSGRAYVYSGKDGRRLLALVGEREGDAFGSTVSGRTVGASTLLVVGAATAGPDKHGRTYVYDRLSATPKFVVDADETGAALGAMFVSVLGDVDGDGVPDVYTSDWPNSAKGASTGRVYVRSGKDGRRLLTLTGETPGEGFGIGAATAGDVDGDERADLVVGAWQYAGAAVSGGRTTVYSGKDGRLLRTYTCRVPGDTFGFDAVGLGDVDGDGAADFLVTSAWSGVHGYHSGRVFVLSGALAR